MLAKTGRNAVLPVRTNSYPRTPEASFPDIDLTLYLDGLRPNGRSTLEGFG